jgi:hypothetical protein
MITESVKYLQQSDDWVKTFVIGSILTLFVIPMFLVVGYLLRVLRVTMRDEDEPPVFDDWGDLAVDGLKGLVIGFAYFLIPGVIGAVLVGFGIAGAVAGGSDAAGILGGVTALVGFLLALVLGLVAAYITPAALSNYAETDRMGAAFALGELRPVLFSGKYATAWLYAFVILIVAGIITGALAPTGIGAILAAAVSFYAYVAMYYIFGTAWGEMHAVEMRDDEMPDERAAI